MAWPSVAQPANGLAWHGHAAPFHASRTLHAPRTLDAPRTLHAQADVWALGVVLYELLALCHPFEARNQAALVLTLTLTPPLTSRSSSP